MAARDMQTRTAGTATEEWVPAICDMCYNTCGVLVRRVGGVAVEIVGDPENPSNQGKTCGKALAGLMNLYSQNRVKTPLKRTNPEKGIGVDPRWVEISWDEALNTVAERLRRTREDDPRKLVSYTFDMNGIAWNVAFGSAFGTPNLGVGASNIYCGNSPHPIAYMYHGSFRMTPDLAHCNYLLLIGSQLGVAMETRAAPMMLTMRKARDRGMKVVSVDPRFSDASALAHEWVPIRPCTDAAFCLALINVLVNELGIFDVEFLKKYTNGPYLIGPDGRYFKDKGTGKPLVWDSKDQEARIFNSPDLKDPALEGSYMVEGVHCNTAFQLLKEKVSWYTPERASAITTVPVETIRRIAKEAGEAAQIGATIEIQGHKLPLRPFAMNWHKGASAHKHSLLIGQSMKLLQVVLGALDVPGGTLAMPSIFSNFGSVRETAEGMLTPTYLFMLSPGYPVRRVTAPESTAARELFPLYWSATPMDLLTLPNPDKYKVPYKAEIFLHCRTNTMMNSVAPEIAAAALESFPFMATICTEIDETSEFADIVLPDVNYLEGMSFFANFVVQCGGMGHFWYMYGHPVVEPAFKAPFQIMGQADILMELADRAGFLEDLNQMINLRFGFKDPYKLDPSKRYTMAEVYDRMAKSFFGEKYGLDWFKEHRVMKVEKTVQQAYPRIFHSARVPVYTEHFLEAGARVEKVTKELGIEWDTSDYLALPEWKPCPAYLEDAPDYDLYCINFKMPMHTFGVTANNPWLAQRSEDRRLYDILINEDAAARRGIEDGDRIRVETPEGRHVVGVAKTTQGIHPEVVATPGIFGQWARARTIAKGRGVHSSALLPLDLSRIDTLGGAVDHTVRVKVSRA